MSNLFGANNFGASAAGNPSSAGGGAAAGPSFGLRQRPVGGASSTVDENANPNNSSGSGVHGKNMPVYGKWGALQGTVRPPPRATLGAGRPNYRMSATPQQQQQSKEVEKTQRALVQLTDSKDDDLSLWVVAYGYQNITHFRAIYSCLERCGTITARRGGLPCFGEERDQTTTDAANNNNNNWVAVRYESAICAQKALGQHRNFVSVGGSTMIMGVMPLNESDAAAQLGINVSTGKSDEQNLKLTGSYKSSSRNYPELRTEADIMMNGGDGGDVMLVDNEVTSGLDSFCGKVLAWFFMWDTQM